MEGIKIEDKENLTESRQCLEDCRSKKVIFLCNCILNANSKVLERARYSGIFSEVMHIIDEFGLGVIQMPCPETLHCGSQRYWGGKNVFENASYRRFCRQLAEQITDYIDNYRLVDYEVIGIVGCDGSPTCGVNFTNHYANGGGRPKPVDRSLLRDSGIFIDELKEALNARGITMPAFYGLGMDIYSKSNEELLDDFRSFIYDRLQTIDSLS